MLRLYATVAWIGNKVDSIRGRYSFVEWLRVDEWLRMVRRQRVIL